MFRVRASNNIYQLLYPIDLNRMQIECPKALPYPKYQNYFFAIRQDVWILYIISLICVVLMVYYFNDCQHDMFDIGTELIKMTTYSPSTIYKKQARHLLPITITWSFGGFILTNFFLSILTSFTAEPIEKSSMKFI